MVGYSITNLTDMILQGTGIPGSGGLIGSAFGSPMLLAGIFLILIGFMLMKSNGNFGVLTIGLGAMIMFFASSAVGLFDPWVAILVYIAISVGFVAIFRKAFS
jgi:hypothetical protein